MNRALLQHQKDVLRISKKYNNPKPVNQLILGVPKHLKGKKFKVIGYLLNGERNKCPYTFEELPYLQYHSQSVDCHYFLSCGKMNHIIVTKIVE